MNGNMRILLADDETFILSIFRSNLQQLGFQSLTVATDFNTAIDVLTEQKIDLLITDIQMGLRSGLDLLRAIRAGEAGAPRTLPVILLTGHADRDLIKAAQRLSVSGFLKKPVAISALGQGIRNAMRAPVSEVSIPPEVGEAIESVSKRYRSKGQGGDALSPRKTTSRASDSEGHLLVKHVDPGSLRPGMVLAADLLDKSGKLIVKRGVSMTEDMIKRIRVNYHTDVSSLAIVRDGGVGK